jgi:hypothetical protein
VRAAILIAACSLAGCYTSSGGELDGSRPDGGPRDAGPIELRDVSGYVTCGYPGQGIDYGAYLLAPTGLFDGCERFHGTIRLAHADAADLTLLSSLRVIDGDLLIGASESLASLHGLERLERVGGDLLLGDAPSDGLVPLRSLREVGGVVDVFDSLAVPSLAGLESLEVIGVDLRINAHPVVTDLDGLRGLRLVRRNASIRQVPREAIDALLAHVIVEGRVSTTPLE